MNQKFHNIKIDLTKSTIPKVHILVQKICFEHGLTWILGGNAVGDTSFPYLFIYRNSISTCHLAGNFRNSREEEVSIQEFLTEQYDSNILLIVSKHMQEYTDISPLPNKWVLQVSNESIIYINEFRSLLSPFFAPVTEKNIGCFIGPEGELYVSSDKSETSYVISLDKFKSNVLYKLRAEKKTDKAAFTLPENWCVEITAESNRELSEYRSSGGRTYGTLAPKQTGGWMDKKGYVHSFLQSNVITIEEFREHVLTPMKTIEQKTISTFVLPDAWCVAVEKNNEPSEVYEWREPLHGSWSNKGYINSYGYHSTTKQEEFQLITFYQFVEHVLKPLRLKREEEGKIHYAKMKSTTQDVILKFDSDSKKSDTTFTLPEKYCVVHHKDVATYLCTIDKYQGWCEDLHLFSHFPPMSEGQYCSKKIKEGYVQITIEQFREHVILPSTWKDKSFDPVTFKEKTKGFVLPNRWYTKITEESKDALSKYRSTGGRTFNPLLTSTNTGYIDDTGYSYASNSENLKFMTEITYDQFCKYVLFSHLDSSDEFVLPESYCVRHHKSVADYINKIDKCSNFSEDLSLFAHFPKFKYEHCHKTIQTGYTEISIEDFRKYVTKTSGDPVIEAAKHEIPITVKSTIDLRAWATKSASPSISQSDEEEKSPLEGVIKTKEITNEELFKPKNNLNTIYHGKKAKENPITIDLCTTYPSISRGKK